MSDAYADFLAAKMPHAVQSGFVVSPDEINPALKDFVRQAVVPWAAAGGRRAIFSSFGLHKTSTQIELARLACARGAAALIVAPLGVRQEFMDDAERYFTGDHAVRLRFIRSTAEAEPDAVNLTNYESVREGKIDVARFGFTSLDEAAILRGFGGTKTFREFMRLFEPVRWRYVATATPDPNEYIELLAYAAYLGVMDIGQAKTRFFKRDSEHADKLTIHPHKEREFWLWVASWALFVRRPSDLGFSDDGYEMPPLDVRWHEVASPTSDDPGIAKDGQMRLLPRTTASIMDAAREKRASLDARVACMREIIVAGEADTPGQWVVWCDLNDEQRSAEAALGELGVSHVSLDGAMPLEERERQLRMWKRRERAAAVSKPVMLGAGVNMQQCQRAVYIGIGHKFHDFIQSVHRLQRFGQRGTVRLDLIHTENERPIRANLEAKWRRHEEQASIMSEIVRTYGLADAALTATLNRSVGVDRQEIVIDGVSGISARLLHNDCVEETRGLSDGSAHLIVTSIPFSTQYEYTPSYNDFGHTDDDAHFWAQMDFLTPELFRVLQPGRIAAIHVKDRIVPGGINGLGFQTVSPFSDDCVRHFRRHGFAFLARKTIVTDVVRENNQTYRLGWTEQCKDGSRMGAGLPEYLLIFRKPQTDRAHGYADVPVVKDKKEWASGRWVNPDGYSRARWQLDAHGFMRSSGNRMLAPQDLRGVPANVVYRLFRDHSLSEIYNVDRHVELAEALEERGSLPPTFMLLPPASWHADVWTDVARMRTLNGAQAAKGREMHLCPLQFDIVDRAIVQYTMPGETVLDPFGGLMTVPYCAVRLNRSAVGIELNPGYFRDGVRYVENAIAGLAAPDLFALAGAELDVQAADEAADVE